MFCHIYIGLRSITEKKHLSLIRLLTVCLSTILFGSSFYFCWLNLILCLSVRKEIRFTRTNVWQSNWFANMRIFHDTIFIVNYSSFCAKETMKQNHRMFFWVSECFTWFNRLFCCCCMHRHFDWISHQHHHVLFHCILFLFGSASLVWKRTSEEVCSNDKNVQLFYICDCVWGFH